MPSPIHPPDLIQEIQALREELDLLTATTRWRGVTFPSVSLGVQRDFSFTSFDTTSFLDFFRSDVLLTAPLLDYDLQTWNFWEATAVTSIEWQITASHYFDPGVPVTTAVVASGQSLAPGDAEQFQGTVDISDPSNLGPAALFRFVRFDLEAKRTGGSGEGAAIRWVRPPILRIPT